MYIHHQQPVSKRARELGDRLTEVIRDAQRQDDKLNYQEVSQATRLAAHQVRQELGGMSDKTRILIVAVLICVVMLVGFLVSYFL